MNVNECDNMQKQHGNMETWITWIQFVEASPTLLIFKNTSHLP